MCLIFLAGPPKGAYGQNLANNVPHTAFTLKSKKLHMDVHLWIECALLTENNINVPNIFWRAVLSSEVIKMKLITHTSHNLNST